MPTWGDLLKEIENEATKKGPVNAVDVVRRRYLERLSVKTGRSTILYAAKWTTPSPVSLGPQFISINDEDMSGLMEVMHGLNGRDGLDIILHSPGGSAEATEAMVKYMRTKFSDIRVFVPHAAMSAATMLACSSNRIVMGKHSSLGPIDPQMILQTQLGAKAVPAQAILDQFIKAQQECSNPKLLASWLPMLSQYGPALLIECEEALNLSQTLVSQWLESYMFKGETDANKKAKEIAKKLADHKTYLSHSRHVDREQAKVIGLVVDDLEEDQDIQDLVLSIYHATMCTFNQTQAVKIIENHNGKAFVKAVQIGPIQVLQPQK